MAILFISDLHLHPSRLATIELFLGFLATPAREAQALYILGDLFESWIGDDDPEPSYAQICTGLERCVRAGTPIYIMHGNRDFLLGPTFAVQTGCTLIPDPTRLDLFGTPTLLMHGDSLCTDDVEYQNLRSRLRDPAWQQQALALPVSDRLELASEARELSTLSNRNKTAAIMDVNPEEVLRVMRQYNVDLLIHGHTHRHAIHTLTDQNRSATRIDLGDWFETASVLVVDEHGWRTERL
ncbi:MAG: UDP-2,3-diacylglucosamine diphosphatase [Thiogranum sp.]|nr:UDP-2,3-diacylglucosamine diphosphatase [Thiogranum sp.]